MPNGCGQTTSRREESELLNCEVPALDIHAESVSVVLITHATASHSTLINEEIIKSIILNSTGPFTAKGEKKSRLLIDELDPLSLITNFICSIKIMLM